MGSRGFSGHRRKSSVECAKRFLLKSHKDLDIPDFIPMRLVEKTQKSSRMKGALRKIHRKVHEVVPLVSRRDPTEELIEVLPMRAVRNMGRNSMPKKIKETRHDLLGKVVLCPRMILRW